MISSTQFTTITTEGGILPSEVLTRLVNDTGSLPGTRAEDYQLTPGRQLREIINRSWNDLLGAWQVYQAQIARMAPNDYTAALTWDRWLLPLFAELGYGRLERFPEAIRVGDKDYPVSHHHGQALVHLVGWNVRLDRRTAGVAGAAKAAPHSMVQELLNRTDDHLWAVVSNGRQLRVLRDNSSLTRAAYVEFDLEQMFSEGIFTDFVALWLLTHSSRLEGDPQSGCWLEVWANEARTQGIRALDTLGAGFEEAIETLGQGFLVHPANADLRESLRDGSLTKQDFYRQLLRIIYRIVFLLVAEDRGLLHPPDASAEAKDRYDRYFSASRIRELARKKRGTKHSDLWEQFELVARALGEQGQTALGLPALNSGLWSADGTAHLGSARIANSNLLTVVRSLAFTRQEQALLRVDYRNLGSEELGSVYESLLELQPVLDLNTGSFSLTHAAGNERKTSGSYYTPSSLITSLLDTGLNPIIDEAMAKKDPETALLQLTILDPACGSGHFLVAAAQRIAQRLATLRSGESEPAPDVFRHALREVISRSIFGIDLNPMAVELCKVSLWLESVEPGKPLSFLDHHIVCGNSLLGTTPELVMAGIPDEAYKVLTGDDRATVTSLRRRNAAERSGQGSIFQLMETSIDDQIAASMVTIEQIPDNDLHAITEKQTRWEELLGSDEMMRARFAADTWCCAFVVEKGFGAEAITTASVRTALDRGVAGLDVELVEKVELLSKEYGFLHLHTAFPQVFSRAVGDGRGVDASRSGGFDVIVGNPPWDQIQYDPQEVFALTHPEIAAAPTMAARNRLVAALETEDPEAYATHLKRLRQMEGIQHFIHGSGRFPLSSFGRLNTAPLFVELTRSAVAPTGSIGVIVPSGIATDSFNQYLFGDIVERRSLVSLYDFENRAGVFPAIHRMIKFSLLTLTGLDRPANGGAEFAFFCQQTDDLQDEGRRFALTAEEILLVNPNTKTCPIFRSRRDADLTLSIYRRVPVLVSKGAEEDNSWGIRFQLMFMMNTASHLFRSSTDLKQHGGVLEGNAYRLSDGRVWLPLYEGKMIHHFDHRWAGVAPNGDFADISNDAKKRPNCLPLPRYWVDSKEVDERLPQDLTWLLGFRDITNATNERTAIAAIIPRTAVGNKLPLLFVEAESTDRANLGACLSSFVLDYVARQKVGGSNLNFFIAEQLPVLPRGSFAKPSPWDTNLTLVDWLRPRLLELNYTAVDLAGFAHDLGFNGPPFIWDDERRSLLRAELDACFFHLYGVGRDDVVYIMNTFPIVRRKDESSYGEYRTARLILEGYDSMSQAIDSGEPYRGSLE